MTTIHQKIKAASLFELNDMLKPPDLNVYISWWGQRTVSIKGHTGSVKINDLCQKYLDTIKATHEPTLETRLRSVELWDKIKNLYDESEAKLQETYLYKYIVPLTETSLCDCLYECHTKTRKRIEPIKYQFLEFSEEEFKKLWPGHASVIPEGKKVSIDPRSVFDSSNKKELTHYYASVEMMKDKLLKNI